MKEQTEVGNNAEILRDPDDYGDAEIKSETPSRFVFKGKPPVSGKKENPLKIFIYGKNGIGKSTFASKMDKPVFLDLERNADHLATDRYPLDSFKDVELFLYELKNQKHAYETVVIDSVDVLERLAFEYVRKNFSDDLEWGKEYSHVLDCFSNIVKRCDLLFTEKKMNIVFLGHEAVRDVKDPRVKTFDCLEPRIRPKNWGVLCDWVNAVLLATNEIYAAPDEKQKFSKQRTGRVYADHTRKMYTTPSPAYVAKNVFELPEKIDMDWHAFKKEIDKFYHQEEGEKTNA